MNKNTNKVDNLKNSLSIEEIKKLIYQFKEEELPYADAPFHFQAEIWSINYF